MSPPGACSSARPNREPDHTEHRLIRRVGSTLTLYLGGTEIHATGGGPKAVQYYTHGGAVVAARTATADLPRQRDEDSGVLDGNALVTLVP
jgi:hypothetical protein